MQPQRILTALPLLYFSLSIFTSTAWSQRIELHRNQERIVVGASLNGTKEACLSVNAKTIEGLAKIETLQGISFLYTTLDDASLLPLRALHNLVTLDLRNSNVTGDGLRILTTFPSLASLNLIGCDISDRDLCNLKDFKNLRVLHLARTKVTDSGMPHIAQMDSLIVLNLSECQITEAALEELSALSNLEYLWLSKTAIGDKSVNWIARMSTLRDLAIVDCRFSESGLSSLREALPSTAIRTDAEQRNTYSLNSVLAKSIQRSENQSP